VNLKNNNSGNRSHHIVVALWNMVIFRLRKVETSSPIRSVWTG